MKKIIKKWAAPLLCGLLTFILFQFVFFIGYVPSESMEPAIKADSIVFGCRIPSEIQRGDILLFHHEGIVLVKRVAGVPGDIIYSDDTGLILSIDEEFPGASRVLTVPDGYYFMLGDNAEHSNDSRMWDEPFVARNEVVAKVWK